MLDALRPRRSDKHPTEAGDNRSCWEGKNSTRPSLYLLRTPCSWWSGRNRFWKRQGPRNCTSQTPSVPPKGLCFTVLFCEAGLTKELSRRSKAKMSQTNTLNPRWHGKNLRQVPDPDKTPSIALSFSLKTHRAHRMAHNLLMSLF